MKTIPLPRLIQAALLATFVFSCSAISPAQSLQNLWELNPPDVDGNIGTDNNQRGLTYNSLSNQVILASRTGGNKAVIYNGDTGALEGYMNLAGVSGGGVFTWNQVACADDGVLYGFNVSGTTFKIYRWDATDPSLTLTTAYGPADPSHGLLPTARWGDNVAIRGSGPATEILAGSHANTNVALFTTTDGTNFSAIRIDIPGINNNDVRDGLAFYTNNTFWAKRVGRPLILVQYTLNTSTTAVGTVIGSFTSSLSPLACVPNAGLLAGVASQNPGQLQLLGLSSLPPTLLTQTNFLTSNANGNGTGAVVFGGEGKTNRIYALWSNNGIKAATISWTAPPSAPVITTQPNGATVYTNMSGITFAVTASGNPPPSYQWYYNNTMIPGATSSSYSKAGPFVITDTGNYTVIVSNSVAAITSTPPALLNVIEPQLTAVMNPIWAITNATRSYLQSDNNARGLAYDPVTDRLVVVSRTGDTNAIYALNAATGADEFALNTLGINSGGGFGTFGLSLVGVANDGVVYAGNMRVNSTDGNVKIYRWDNVDAGAFPAFAYDSDPAPGLSLRWGDSFAVRGAGTDTQIIMGSATGIGTGAEPGQYVALFTTGDGFNYSAQLLTAPTGTPNNFAQLGIAFGSGNTFWAKSSGFRLRHFSYDPTFTDLSLTLLGEYDLPARLVPATAIAVNPNLGLLATVEVANPDSLQLYQLPTTTNPPVLLDQEFFATDNPNGNATAAVAFGTNNTLYALDTNNGLLARSLNTGAALPALTITRVTPTTTPDLGAVVTWQTLVGGTYQLQFKGDLNDVTWTDVGAPVVANNRSLSVSDTGTGFTNRFYRVEKQP
jgi:hypothetical protein